MKILEIYIFSKFFGDISTENSVTSSLIHSDKPIAPFTCYGEIGLSEWIGLEITETLVEMSLKNFEKIKIFKKIKKNFFYSLATLLMKRFGRSLWETMSPAISRIMSMSSGRWSLDMEMMCCTSRASSASVSTC